MKIICYCQHVLGIGHFHRSLAICRELATRHEVVLVVGGPPVDGVDQEIQLYQLPGLQMDREFNNLAPCDPERPLDEVKQDRCTQLFSLFATFQPDLFLVELYPFGRKAFRFELDPLLKAIKDGRFGNCRAYVSLRDILVERIDDKEKFEQRAVTTLNSYFDGLLIHSDERFITLDETFGRYSDIETPLCYTGFITPERSGRSRQEMRNALSLHPHEKMIVVSVGGGNVGGELLTAAVEAFKLIDNPDISMQIFTGPYCDDTTFAAFTENSVPRLRVDRFTAQFSDWLLGSDLSISMAGYNTCMNLAQAGIPALIYPFDQNREQTMRAERLANQLPFTLLDALDLEPQKLARMILSALSCARKRTSINLAGAHSTREQIELWQDEN